MMPSMPMRAASLAVSTAKAVVNSAIPQSTGTRPFATDFAASMIWIFSERSSEVFSPTEPQTMRPDTPSLIRLSMTLAVRSMSSDRSSWNWVVTAGKTPSQEMRADMGFSPGDRSWPGAQSRRGG